MMTMFARGIELHRRYAYVWSLGSKLTTNVSMCLPVFRANTWAETSSVYVMDKDKDRRKNKDILLISRQIKKLI